MVEQWPILMPSLNLCPCEEYFEERMERAYTITNKWNIELNLNVASAKLRWEQRSGFWQKAIYCVESSNESASKYSWLIRGGVAWSNDGLSRKKSGISPILRSPKPLWILHHNSNMIPRKRKTIGKCATKLGSCPNNVRKPSNINLTLIWLKALSIYWKEDYA